MSTVVVSESLVICNEGGTTETLVTVTTIQTEVVECDCCGLTEECTAAYISRIRERYQGKWICGLCTEAVNYEMRLLSTEEALIQHMSFCNQFKSALPPPNPALHLISAMRHILRRSMSSSVPMLNQTHEMNM